jgi:hypothetical protein
VPLRTAWLVTFARHDNASSAPALTALDGAPEGGQPPAPPRAAAARAAAAAGPALPEGAYAQGLVTSVGVAPGMETNALYWSGGCHQGMNGQGSN